MSAERDLDHEMRRFPLDERTTDRLLSGSVAPEDAPPGLERVSALIRTARGPAGPAELAHESSVVIAMAAAVRANPSVHPSSPGKKPMLTRLLSAKVAAVAATMVLGVTGAAAATNSLPDPAQSAVSEAASHLGVSVPRPSDDGAAHDATDDHQPGNGHATGPDATGAARSGLCHAFGERESNSVAAQNLATAAADAGQSVAAFCAATTPTTVGGSDDPAGHDATDDHTPTSTRGASDNRGPSANSGPGNASDRGDDDNGTDDHGRTDGSTVVSTPTSTPSTVAHSEDDGADDSGHHGGGDNSGSSNSGRDQ